MPWKESDAMSERMKLVMRLIEGESMSEVCREFEISRKTGYKLWNRYKECGAEAFIDRPRRLQRLSNETGENIKRMILELKGKRSTWGAPKIREYLQRKYPNIEFPARSTVHAILERNGLVKRRGQVRHLATGTNLSATNAPNDLWCVDFKGEFRLGNKRYCYPLTITDHYSRYLLCCESLESTKEAEAIPVFKRVFAEYGLPTAIRSDNGSPFATRNFYQLSTLSVLWLKLGIKIERTKPSSPQENGRHERMHRTLKADTTKPSGKNHIHQQEMFEEFMTIYNTERPHEALNMRTPSDIYTKPSKQYEVSKLTLNYPDHDRTYRVAINGKFEPKKGHHINLGKAFAGEMVGIKEVDDGLYRISFAEYDIAYYDFFDKKIERLPILIPPQSPVS